MVLLIITGVVLGSLIGDALGDLLPFLSYGPGPLGINNFQLDLSVIYLNFSLLIKINVASLIGLLLAVVIFNRL